MRTEYHTCRLCNTFENAFMLKYGVRHYAHVRCLHKAYTPDAFKSLLMKTPLWQVKAIPYREAAELGILNLLHSILGHDLGAED